MRETVRGNDGRNTKKLALYFRGQKKALIVNATNFDLIVGITGKDDSDDWIGALIELFATTTEMAGGSCRALGLARRARRPRMRRARRRIRSQSRSRKTSSANLATRRRPTTKSTSNKATPRCAPAPMPAGG